MQCKDIPTEPILRFLDELTPAWANRFGTEFESGKPNWRSVLHAMPDDVGEKLALAKMRRLINKGLVDGCACGCRGDFVITPKGMRRLGKSEEEIVRHVQIANATFSIGQL